jgi:hypothetical protein
LISWPGPQLQNVCLMTLLMTNGTETDTCYNMKMSLSIVTYTFGAPEFTPSLVFSGVRVTRSLVLYVLYPCLSFCTFSFGHCVVCSSSIYRF